MTCRDYAIKQLAWSAFSKRAHSLQRRPREWRQIKRGIFYLSAQPNRIVLSEKRRVFFRVKKNTRDLNQIAGRRTAFRILRLESRWIFCICLWMKAAVFVFGNWHLDDWFCSCQKNAMTEWTLKKFKEQWAHTVVHAFKSIQKIWKKCKFT